MPYKGTRLASLHLWEASFMKNRLSLIFTIALSFLTSCAGSKQATIKDTITIAMTEEPPSLNATTATDAVSFFVLGHIMEGLTRYGRGGEIVPGIAEKWANEGLTFTFHLRDTSKWSDGKPVTAQDFVFAWQTALDPATASEYAFILYPVKNGRAINEKKMPVESLGAEAVDSHTLKVTLEKPCGYFLSLTAFGTYFPLRKDFYEAHKDKYAAEASEMLCNGPFNLVKWVHQASLRMEKNEYYWNAATIRVKAIDVPYITSDSQARYNLFKDGKIDLVGLDKNTIENAKNDYVRMRTFADGAVFYYEFNHRKGRLTANKNLRKAIQAVHDPDEYVNKVVAVPGTLPGKSLFPTWLKGVNGYFREEYKAPERKVDGAAGRRYLEAALMELKLQTPPTLVFLTGDSATAAAQAEYMQDVLKKTLGIALRIDKQIFKQRLKKMTDGDFDIVAAGWAPDFADPKTFADLFTCWNQNNRGRYCNPALDKLEREADSTMDPKIRMDAFGKIQQLIDDEVVVIPNSESGTAYLMNPSLKGVERNVLGPDPLYVYAYFVKAK
jgi:oligopeptide transport system substrate-binding protein